MVYDHKFCLVSKNHVYIHNANASLSSKYVQFVYRVTVRSSYLHKLSAPWPPVSLVLSVNYEIVRNFLVITMTNK